MIMSEEGIAAPAGTLDIVLAADAAGPMDVPTMLTTDGLIAKLVRMKADRDALEAEQRRGT
jgi:hypothetical protein